jgi:biotin carboxyl carrier protein
MRYTAKVAGRSFELEVDHDRLVWVDGYPLYVDMEQVGGLPVYSLALDDKGYVLFVEKGQGEYLVEVQGEIYPVDVQLQRPQLNRQRNGCPKGQEGCLTIRAPLPGRLLSLCASAGERVEAGQVVAVVESMKMQIEMKAPHAGVVQAVCGPANRDVDQGEGLVSLQAAAEAF